MLCWTMPSRPVEVCALMHNRGTRVDVDSAITFRCADGCLGSIAIHGSGPKAPGMIEDISISGESGRAIYLRRGKVSATKDGVFADLHGIPLPRRKQGSPLDRRHPRQGRQPIATGGNSCPPSHSLRPAGPPQLVADKQ